MKKKPIYKYLISLNKPKVFIKELNPLYSPLEIGSQIGSLIEQELIYVDWDKKTILIENLTIESAFMNKDAISKYTRKVPGYMKSEKQELNKPYIDKEKRDKREQH